MGELESGWETVKRLGRAIVGIFRQTLDGFSETHAAQASAGIAYYAFFSLFPLLLLLVVLGSTMFEADAVAQKVIDLTTQVLPVSTLLLERNITRALTFRTSFGIVGLLSLLWSATGVFSALAFNINLAWKGVPKRNFLQKRLLGLIMVAILGFLYVSFLLVTITIRSLPALQAIFSNVQFVEMGTVVRVVNFLSPWVVIFLLYFALYRWVPSARVHLVPALVSASISTVMWHLVTKGFTWFIKTGLNSYELVYGTLGTVVALMLLIYMNAWIILFGAHLCAAIQMQGGKPLFGAGNA